MQKVLITGIAGFVGHYFIEEIIKDYHVIGTDITTVNPNPEIK